MQIVWLSLAAISYSHYTYLSLSPTDRSVCLKDNVVSYVKWIFRKTRTFKGLIAWALLVLKGLMYFSTLTTISGCILTFHPSIFLSLPSYKILKSFSSQKPPTHHCKSDKRLDENHDKGTYQHPTGSLLPSRAQDISVCYVTCVPAPCGL